MTELLQILLIEDDRFFAQVIRQILSQTEDMEGKWAATLADGLRLLNEAAYHLVLLDLELPDSAGFDTFARLKAATSCPIIVMTGQDSDTLAMQAIQNGAQDYLYKTNVWKDVLVRAVRYAIERQRSENELREARNELEKRVQERTLALQQANEQLTVELKERKTLEQIWRRYAFIVNTSKEFMTLVRRDYCYEAVNEAYCLAHGLSRGEIVGKTVGQIWGEAGFHRHIQPFFERCFQGEEVHSQLWLAYANLGKRYMEVTYYPYFTIQGIVSHAVVVSRDMTHQKKAEVKLRKYAERLRFLTKQLVNAQEDERRRLSRELHDEAGQMLTALKINLKLMQNRLAKPEALHADLQEAIDQVGQTMDRLRMLAHHLRPPALDTLGLHQALEDYCHKTARQTGLHIQYAGDDIPALPSEIAITLYRVAQEALTNTIKHARARRIAVTLKTLPHMVRLFVLDDGAGFNPQADAQQREGIGLLGMEERIEALGGRMTLVSQKDKGTALLAEIPWRNHHD